MAPQSAALEMAGTSRRKTHRGKKRQTAPITNHAVDDVTKNRQYSVDEALRSQLAQHAKEPSEQEILDGVRSLYDDRLKPFSRILRKRLIERAAAKKECSASWLLNFCKKCPALHVENEAGGEWSVVLNSEGGNFVDYHDAADPYPAELWEGMASFVDCLAANASLPGGRYGSACDLAKRRLAFLQHYTLGEICHIIELAISKHKLLGYSNGAIVPYQHSTSMMKSKCATECRAIKSANDGVDLLSVDWETARSTMRSLLDAAVAQGMQQIPLSNVKRLFRSLHSMDLSETKLGHSKVTDLLRDSRFADICHVELQERGYAVLPVATSTSVSAAQADVAMSKSADRKAEEGTADGESMVQSEVDSDLQSQGRPKFCEDEPLCLQDADYCVSSDIEAIFPITPSPCPNSHRGLSKEQWHATCDLLGFQAHDLDNLEDDSKMESSISHTSPAPFCVDEPLRLEGVVQMDSIKTPLSMTFPLMTPSPLYAGADKYSSEAFHVGLMRSVSDGIEQCNPDVWPGVKYSCAIPNDILPGAALLPYTNTQLSEWMIPQSRAFAGTTAPVLHIANFV